MQLLAMMYKFVQVCKFQNLQLCTCASVQDCAGLWNCASVWNCAGLCKPRLLWQRNCVSYPPAHIAVSCRRRFRHFADCQRPLLRTLLRVSTRPLFDQLVHFSDRWQPGSIYCSALVRTDTSHFFRLLSSHWPRSNTLGFGTKQNCCRL